MIGRNDPCWCGSGQKWKKCHFPQEPREGLVTMSFEKKAKQYLKTWGIILKTPEQIEGIKVASAMAVSVLELVSSHAKAGVSTGELDQIAYESIVKQGAIPASLHYGNPPFPKSICVSRNEIICHGIPDQTKLIEGDIVNIDVAVIYNGYYGDCSKMVAIGEVSSEKKLVFEVSYDCLMNAIAVAAPGVPINAIGEAIDDTAHKRGCSVVTDFVGHGVGLRYHEPPHIYHYFTESTIPLCAGMTFTIEPMINAGVHEVIVDSTDHWTARTADGRPSAQWEHTLLITDTGVEILTPWSKMECLVKKNTRITA